MGVLSGYILFLRTVITELLFVFSGERISGSRREPLEIYYS